MHRGMSNQPTLARGDAALHRKGLEYLTVYRETLRNTTGEPWERFTELCECIARYGLGNCQEAAELTYLYLSAALLAGQLPDRAKVIQFTHPEFDHAVAAVVLDGVFHLADAWLTVPLPCILEQAGSGMAFSGDFARKHFAEGNKYKRAKQLRSCSLDSGVSADRLAEAVSRVELAAREQRVDDEDIRRLPEPGEDDRYHLVDGDRWMLSKRHPAVTYTDGMRELSFDECSLNDYFQAQFSRLDRLAGQVPRAGHFDFSLALDRLIQGEPAMLLELQTSLGMDPEVCAPLLLELLQIGCSAEERKPAMRVLVCHCADRVACASAPEGLPERAMLVALHNSLTCPRGWMQTLLPLHIEALDESLRTYPDCEGLENLLLDLQDGTGDYALALVQLLADRDQRSCFSPVWIRAWNDPVPDELWYTTMLDAVRLSDHDALAALIHHPDCNLVLARKALIQARKEGEAELVDVLSKCHQAALLAQC